MFILSIKVLVKINIRNTLFILLLLVTQLFSIQFSFAQSVTDSAGRIVEVPENVQRIYAAGSFYLLSINPMLIFY